MQPADAAGGGAVPAHALASAPAAARPAAPPWPPLDRALLEGGRPDLPAFPRDILPSAWNAWVAETAHIVGAPVDYVAQALLAAVAGATGPAVVARLGEGWDEPLILWQVLVGGPAAGKSAALDGLRRALGGVERTLAPHAQKLARLVDEPAALPALRAAAKQRPRGALLWRDDPGGEWLQALGRTARRKPIETGPLLAAYAPLRTALGPGEPAISLIGSLDPAVLAGALSGTWTETGDGRVQRLLFAWPAPPPYRSYLARPTLRESDAVNALARIVRETGTPEVPMALVADERARAVLERHLAELHADIRARDAGGSAADARLAGWLARGRGTVPRLAAALTLLRWTGSGSALAPPPTTLGGEAMLAAVVLWTWYRAHTEAVLRHADGPAGDPRLRAVVRWLRHAAVREISRTELRRVVLGQTVNAREAQHMVERLEAAGCLRPIADDGERGRGRPALRWAVNPRLTGELLAKNAENAGPGTQGTIPAGKPAQ